MKPSSPVCPVCASETVAKYRFGRYTLRHCRRCSFIFCHPLPTKAELDAYYSDAYFDKPRYNVSEEDEIPEPVARPWKRRLGVIDELVVSEKASGSRCLLDIGAGTGIFAALAGEAGWEVSCVEFSEHGREDIKRRLGPECHVASRFEPDAYSDEHFDLITLWAVFEHMPYAVNTLRAWYGKLKPGGVLAVSTPNTRCLNRCLFGKNWRYFCPPEHIAYYNESVLQRVFGEVGFRPLRAEKFFSREAFFEGLGRFSRLKGIKSLERVVWKTADAMGWGDTIEIFFRKTTQFRTS